MEFANVSEYNSIESQVDVRDPMGVRDLGLLQLAWSTGLRVSELASLNHFDVMDAGQVRQVLYVRPATAKYQRGRQIPLNALAQEAIRKVVDFNRRRGFSTAPQAPLFSSKKHQRITVRAIQRLVEDLRKKANLAKPITPHSIRHAFACRVLKQSNLIAVKELLGHERLETCNIYLHLDVDELKDAVDRI